ncbi:hypothetical protein JKG47_22350, partial [Acidithiobacillus sp. MC6.1]|nr:hypothetical protein [Acidithiobacillus sp. MC6.1]
GTPPGSGSGNGTGTAPGIAPASLSPEAIKSQLQNFTPNPLGQNKQGAGAPTKPAASPSSPGNAPAASGEDAAQSEQVPAETSAANGDAGSTDTAPNGDSMSMSKGPDGKPQVSATTIRPDGARTHTTAGGSQADSKQVSGPTSTGAAGATDTGASGTGAGTAGGNSGGGGNTPASQQAPDLNKTLERLNQSMAALKPRQQTTQQKLADTAIGMAKGGLKAFKE